MFETNRRFDFDFCRIRHDLDGNADDEPYHKSVTTMSQRPETVVNLNRTPPRKGKAQELRKSSQPPNGESRYVYLQRPILSDCSSYPNL